MHHIVLESPTVKPNHPVPRRHTSQGGDVSPVLRWHDLPPNTKQLAVVLEDRDMVVVPGESPFIQWMVYGIPPTATGLPAHLPEAEILAAPRDIAGSFQARTRFDVTAYRGPEPPAGQLHHYRFVVYALDANLGLERDLFANAVLSAIKPHIIGEGSIAATYKRGPEAADRSPLRPK